MNSRFLQALRCEKPDRVPFLPATYEHKAWFVGTTPSDVCRDPGLLVSAMLAEHEQTKPDALTIGVDIYNVEAEAVGCKVTFYEAGDTSVPSIKPADAVFRGPEDAAALRVPDPRNDGRMPVFLEVARTMMNKVGKEIPLRGAVSGPFSLAAHLAGPEKLLLLTMTQPWVVKDLLGFCAEVIKRYGRAFLETGCGVVMFDSYASSALIPPQIYGELVLPPARDIVAYFHQHGAHDVPLIIGGNTTAMLDAYLASGANDILCDAKADPQEFLAKCSAMKRSFRRNIDSGIFADASPAAVKEIALQNLMASKGYPGFILGTGVLPYGTPTVHLLAIHDAIEEYRRQTGSS